MSLVQLDLFHFLPLSLFFKLLISCFHLPSLIFSLFQPPCTCFALSQPSVVSKHWNVLIVMFAYLTHAHCAGIILVFFNKWKQISSYVHWRYHIIPHLIRGGLSVRSTSNKLNKVILAKFREYSFHTLGHSFCGTNSQVRVHEFNSIL